MKFYCEECNETYEAEDLNERHYYNIDELCFECPECENMNLVSIVPNNSLGLCWDGEVGKVTCVEYDKNTKVINESNEISLKNLTRVIYHHMEHYGETEIKIGGLDIRKSGE